MSKPPAFQFYAADFEEDTAQFMCDELGAYMRLLCHQWINGSVPNDLARLASIARVGLTDMQRYWPVLSPKFVAGDDGLLRNLRMEQSRQQQELWSVNGRRAADARWHTQPDAPSNALPMREPIRNGCGSDALQSSTSKQKQKPRIALAMPDPRHSEISVHIQSLYTKATTVYPAPWGKGEAGALALLLKSNPSWTATHIKRLVDNRFSSEENHADPPRLWITRLPAYAQPLDRYGKPIQKANGAAIGMDREITPESRDLTARQLAANVEWLRKKKAEGKTLNEFEERMLQEHSHV